jgi:alkanesulfonate monooxygenase SsuD/methylene tetrahydromethanopterin reductase-like flavin-dependent oxidoreductase (luciferase family)
LSAAVRLGVTLPSFRDGPEPALAVARAADAAGLDGVFAFDHLFRLTGDGGRRPALEMLTLLGAVAVETSRITIGPLAARATLRPAATLANGLDTLARIVGPDRFLVTVGAGDEESREENESFGLGYGTVDHRVQALRAAVTGCRDHGYPVWVAGIDPRVREVAAADADGWNRWGGSAEQFGAEAALVRAAATRTPFAVSWAGLAVIGATEPDAVAKAGRLGASASVTGGPERVADAVRGYAQAGAEWVVLGPVDSSDPDNAAILGELVRPLL